MAAYAAVISLKNTIQRILESSRISLVPPSSDIIELVYSKLNPLQKILTRLDGTSKSKSRKKVNALDEKIKDALWRLEDLLDSHLSDQIILSRSETDVLFFSIDLQGLQHHVDSFIKTLKEMEEQYIHELENMPEEEEEFISSGGGAAKSKMVGLSEQFEKAKNALVLHRRNNVYSFVGTPGIGKTTLAKEIYEDPTIVNHFEGRAWVEVGRKSKFDDIALDILAQVAPNIICAEGTHNHSVVVECLRKGLDGKRCLIVLDDVWDEEVLDHLKRCLPEVGKGIIQILVTARDRGVTKCISRSTLGLHVEVVRFLNVKESKDLLLEKVFGDEDFPRQLENAAEKIAENCEGLPLMIVTVADLLSKAEKTLEYWNEVAEKRNSLFLDAYNAILQVLFPSYNYLPYHLKMFFLYMGVFPQDWKISPSEFTNMLIAEEFLEKSGTETEGIVEECLYDLDFWKNIVIVNKKSVNWYKKEKYLTKNIRLHSSWNHLCKEEAKRLKFFNVLNKLCDALGEDIKGQRRLCLDNSILFGIKSARESVEENCAFSVHSLLCFGPYHQYQVSIDVGFKLLRILHALKLRFYEFPIEILDLVHLEYLALTYNGGLPSSLSKLFNLQFLIIHPHMSIRSCKAPSYLPIEIWDMQELKHIEILGSCLLPTPNSVDSFLKKLSTLLGVSANSLTRDVLSRIPNIRKLGIEIELTPPNDSNPLRCFDHISELNELEILKCSIVNPMVTYGFVAPITPPSMFPSRMRKLHLSGLGYPWKCMHVIGSLPNLVVLKLRCYAFRGPVWETKINSFLGLEYLLIEDTDLVHWRPSRGSFPKLHNLILRHCYKLQELRCWPSDSHYGRIELVECNPLAVTCAKKLGEKHLGLHIISRSRLDDGDVALENQAIRLERWRRYTLLNIIVGIVILLTFIRIVFKINLLPFLFLLMYFCWCFIYLS